MGMQATNFYLLLFSRQGNILFYGQAAIIGEVVQYQMSMVLSLPLLPLLTLTMTECLMHGKSPTGRIPITWTRTAMASMMEPRWLPGAIPSIEPLFLELRP